MKIPVLVKPLEHYKLYIKYSDGLSGEINLEHLKNKPEFAKLVEEDFFNKVRIDGITKDLLWDDGISLCKNALYKQLELKNLLRRLSIDESKI
ncbi:MAG: DUF2442 domain-containing protein [Bacteroidetes bacterium]|nr:DUF2442 domain-containing protein [Bacteroidota bacterium]MBU2508078.1 DUF2442 domain-containing protein [Bacteroidota bacterium]